MRLAPGFAGSFYPASPDELTRLLDGYLAEAQVDLPPGEGSLLGGIVPHAGYVYSDRCAARLYARLAAADPDALVLMGPSHRVSVEGAAVLDAEAFETPLGAVAVEQELGTRLAESTAGLHVCQAFPEHSLEVQLPFLQRVLPGRPVVLIAFGMPDHDLARRMAAALRERAAHARLLVLASSDLSHFHPRSQAARLDGRFATRVSNLEVDGLWQDLLNGTTEACGAGPVLTLLEFARAAAGRMEVLHLCDSADVTGDEEDVVGYLAASAVGGAAA